MSYRHPIAGALIAVVAAAVLAPGAAVAADSLEAAIAAPHRSDANRARDQYRNPLETLNFFGIEPDMTVVEIWPGGGAWYMEILAPYLRGQGTYYAASFDTDIDSDFIRTASKRFQDRLDANPELFDKVIVTALSANKTEIAPPGSADMVLTFRNVHNWMAGDYAEAVFEAIHRALKPGGILGLVEHRGDPAVPQDPKAASGYVNEDYVIAMAEAAGLELVDRADISANPRDTKDHPAGVWTLPPTLRLGDQDRDTYLAIGESDRMTLKFRKPE